MSVTLSDPTKFIYQEGDLRLLGGKGWDPEQHPRYPRGHPLAGQFMDKGDLEAWNKLKPVRDVISKMPTMRSRSAPPVHHAVLAMERVLRLPEQPPERQIEIRPYGTRAEGHLGRYNPLSIRMELFDVRLDSETTLSFAENPASALTTVHEMGHYFDHVVLADGVGVRDRLDKIEADNASLSDPADGQFPSAVTNGVLKYAADPEADDHPVRRALYEWTASTYGTRSISELRALAEKPEVTVAFSSELGHEIPVQIDHVYVRYLADLAEVWARALEQYIALRSDDQQMRGYITEHRRFTGEAALSYHHYWEWDEFEIVAEKLDEIFAALGWLSTD